MVASSYTRPVGLDEPFGKVALQRKACSPDNCLHVRVIEWVSGQFVLQITRDNMSVFLLYYEFQPCVVVSSYSRPVGLDEPYRKVALQKKTCYQYLYMCSCNQIVSPRGINF